MSGYVITPNLPAAQVIKSMEREYRLAVSKNEIAFLAWFLPYALSVWHDRTDLLELCVLGALFERLYGKLVTPQDRKIKLKAFELLGLKRTLRKLALPAEWNIDRNSLLAKIDQLTVGIN